MELEVREFYPFDWDCIHFALDLTFMLRCYANDFDRAFMWKTGVFRKFPRALLA